MFGYTWGWVFQGNTRFEGFFNWPPKKQRQKDRHRHVELPHKLQPNRGRRLGGWTQSRVCQIQATRAAERHSVFWGTPGESCWTVISLLLGGLRLRLRSLLLPRKLLKMCSCVEEPQSSQKAVTDFYWSFLIYSVMISLHNPVSSFTLRLQGSHLKSWRSLMTLTTSVAKYPFSTKRSENLLKVNLGDSQGPYCFMMNL